MDRLHFPRNASLCLHKDFNITYHFGLKFPFQVPMKIKDYLK